MKTLIKPISHISSVRYTDLTTSQYVQQVLGWTHQEYCNYQFEQYEDFAESDFYNHRPIIDKLRHSAVFRGFWNNEWALRNEIEFLPFAKDSDLPIWELKAMYKYIHSYEKLQSDHQFLKRYESVLSLALCK
jgi:hypothetical protein